MFPLQQSVDMPVYNARISYISATYFYYILCFCIMLCSKMFAAFLLKMEYSYMMFQLDTSVQRYGIKMAINLMFYNFLKWSNVIVPLLR